MTDDIPDDRTAFIQMATEFPLRTGLFTVGPPVFALLQLLNGLVHDGALIYIGLFATVMILFSLLLTQYHVAVYRRKTVSP